MLRPNINIIGKGDVNLYINGISLKYLKCGNNQGKHSFLIPRTDYDKLVDYLKDKVQFKKFAKFSIIDRWFKPINVDIYFSLTEYDEEVWYKFSDDKMIYIFDTYIYGHENYFEFKIDSRKIKIDKADLRDLKIKNIFENEI